MQLGCLALRRTDPSLLNFVEMILRRFWQRLDSMVHLSWMVRSQHVIDSSIETYRNTYPPGN